MRTILKHWFTAKDNEHYEIGRMLWALAVLSLISFEGYALTTGRSFDCQAYAIGAGAILTCGGFGISLKDKA